MWLYFIMSLKYYYRNKNSTADLFADIIYEDIFRE